MDLNLPTISIIMPAYNASKYINEAIDSILNQTFSDFELLICDDGSTDKTVAIINTYKDPRVILFQNQVNIGNLKTTNFLLRQCKGQYIAIQDSDDISNTNRLQAQILEFQKNPNLGIVGSYYFCINSDGDIFNCGLLPIEDKTIRKEMKNKVPPVLYPSIMVKTEIANKIGEFRLFFDRIGSADFDWMSRIIEKSEAINIPIPLYYYRKHESQFTSNYNPVGNLFLMHMHYLVVEAHKQRILGKNDFIEKNDKLAMRKFIGSIYINKAEDFFWQNKFKDSLKSLLKSTLIFPLNHLIYRTMFFILRKKIAQSIR